MFVVIGCVNMLVAVVILLWLPGTPDEAKFLSEEERAFIDLRLRLDQAGVGLKVRCYPVEPRSFRFGAQY
jgi:hypothetical protein